MGAESTVRRGERMQGETDRQRKHGEREKEKERERERAPRDSQTDRRESMRETDTWKEKVRGTQRKQGAETEIHGAGGGGD